MRALLTLISFLTLGFCFSQIPVYEYRELNKSLKVPATINSERSAVIVHVPDLKTDFRRVGDWKKLAREAHRSLITMGIDPIIYLNHYDLMVSPESQEAYVELLSRREVKNVLFLTKKESGFDFHIVAFNGKRSIIDNQADAFFVSGTDLYGTMLKTGKEIKRADYEIENFLIPEKPFFLPGISIIEKTQLKNYPGILRRSTLAVERFTKLSPPENASAEIADKYARLNAEVDTNNAQLDSIMKKYPYDYVMIDPMSDDDLVRNRHQFVLRHLGGSTETIRRMLDYTVSPNENYFVSIIPVMPDQTRTKTVPKDAIVYKFYIRQNISKNVHVGEWDADETWQDALRNMIGNLIQEHQNSN